MPTVAEQLEKTQNSIKEANEVLLATREHEAEIQAQIDASRKMIAESLDVLRGASEEGPE